MALDNECFAQFYDQHIVKGRITYMEKHLANSAETFSVLKSFEERSRSFDFPPLASRKLRFTCSASFDSCSDKEFSKKIEDIAIRIQLSNEDNGATDSKSDSFGDDQTQSPVFELQSIEPPWEEIQKDSPDWSTRGGGNGIIPSIIERKVNSVELPLCVCLFLFLFF
ncbi:hypothetical protein K1719_017366 [Acacia pycnantha]|nr:hypothetical protein K1719_017366 [Acacia pycnantha]